MFDNQPDLAGLATRIHDAGSEIYKNRGVNIATEQSVSVAVSEEAYVALLRELAEYKLSAAGPWGAYIWAVDPPASREAPLEMSLRVFGIKVRPSKDLENHEVVVRGEVAV